VTPTKPRRRKKKRLPEYLTEEEITRLFAAIGKDVRSQAIFHVMYYRGLRPSEIGRLRVEDYRAAVGRLFVRRLKGSNSGEFHITESERVALNRWLRVRGKDPSPLFPSRNHNPLSRFRIFVLMKHWEGVYAAGDFRNRRQPLYSYGQHRQRRGR
jgi:integrase